MGVILHPHLLSLLLPFSLFPLQRKQELRRLGAGGTESCTSPTDRAANFRERRSRVFKILMMLLISPKMLKFQPQVLYLWKKIPSGENLLEMEQMHPSAATRQ